MLALALMLSGAFATAQATTSAVENSLDSGVGSLRDLVAAASPAM